MLWPQDHTGHALKLKKHDFLAGVYDHEVTRITQAGTTASLNACADVSVRKAYAILRGDASKVQVSEAFDPLMINQLDLLCNSFEQTRG